MKHRDFVKYRWRIILAPIRNLPERQLYENTASSFEGATRFIEHYLRSHELYGRCRAEIITPHNSTYHRTICKNGAIQWVR